MENIPNEERINSNAGGDGGRRYGLHAGVADDDEAAIIDGVAVDRQVDGRFACPPRAWGGAALSDCL